MFTVCMYRSESCMTQIMITITLSPSNQMMKLIMYITNLKVERMIFNIMIVFSNQILISLVEVNQAIVS